MPSPFTQTINLIFPNKNTRICVTFSIQNPSYRVKTNKTRR